MGLRVRYPEERLGTLVSVGMSGQLVLGTLGVYIGLSAVLNPSP